MAVPLLQSTTSLPLGARIGLTSSSPRQTFAMVSELRATFLPVQRIGSTSMPWIPGSILFWGRLFGWFTHVFLGGEGIGLTEETPRVGFS